MGNSANRNTWNTPQDVPPVSKTTHAATMRKLDQQIKNAVPAPQPAGQQQRRVNEKISH